ncbi:EAL domain-containing protein [Dactylosporangium sp. NPDC051484]|uniref:EAL domain-containing protein n=1 Tax=Dactylosporangium sp. NPDC051484 TaxID=3154942 RepID=UPI00345048FF
MQAQDRPDVPIPATAASPSVSASTPAPLRPSSFRSRVSWVGRTLAPRSRRAAASGKTSGTTEVSASPATAGPGTPAPGTAAAHGGPEVFGGLASSAASGLSGSSGATGLFKTAVSGAGVGSASRGRVTPWDGPGGELIHRVIAERAVEPFFQPIVELRSLRPVGVEALARGPVGSELWQPRALFAAAVAAGRLAELDTLCAERALEVARGADKPPPLVFVNAEPAVVDQPLSPRLLELMTGGPPFRIVLEYTERALAARPAALLQLAAAIQSHGNCLALDDVGADPMSLAFLPLLEPEVVKLDLQLLRAPHAPRTVEIVAAVSAVAERTGAVIVAEGIETAADLANARALGAHWGQGLLFGGPAPIARLAPFDRDCSGGQDRTAGAAALRPSSPGLHLPAGTPFEAAAALGKVRAGTPEVFAAHLEHLLRRAGTGAVVLASCTHPAAARSWLPSLTGLAERVAFVGLVAPLHPAAIAPGVRFAPSPGADFEECAAVVVAPRYTAALCGRGSHGTLTFAHTEDSALVASMARMILQQLPR